MPSTPQQTTHDAPITLESAANSGTIDDVTRLLAGIEPEAEAPPETETPAETDKTVAEALAEAEKPDDSGETREAIKPPKSLDELAERLDVEVADLYAIEFPAAKDGESRTIGELKDLLAQESDHAGRELALEERRIKQESDQVKARQDLETILASLPPEAIKPEILEKARREREAYLDREAARTLDVIPEWENDQTKREDWKAIVEHMGEYGFSAQHVENIADHQMIRYMRDNMSRKALVDRALADVKPVKKIPKTTRTAPAKPLPKAPAAGPDSSIDEQLAAIDSLLPKG